MRHTLFIRDLQSIDSAASGFIREISDRKLIAFHAPMGAGKTTFTTAVCKALGVEADAISSPTFAIVNEYRTRSGDSVFHFDFYRLESAREALDLGFYDYIDSGCLCLMEWPENIAEIIPDEALNVTITVAEDGSRTLEWED